jgi:hypothetical protein
MAFPIIPKKRSGATGSPTSLTVGELAVNTATGELFLGGDDAVLLLNPPTAAGTTVTERTGDGTTTAFTFTGYNGTADGGYLVSVGGIDQPPSKYAISSTAGGTITFVDAPVNGELISIRAMVAGSGGSSSNATQLQGRDLSDQVPDDKMSVTWNQSLNTWQPSFTTELGGVPISATTPTAGNLLRFDGTNWAPFNGLAVPAWDSTIDYMAGDVVTRNSIVFICIQSMALNQDPAGANGQFYWATMPGIYTGSTVPSDAVNVAGWVKVQVQGLPGTGLAFMPFYQ